MLVENMIRTVYANYLVVNFGSDGLAMFHDLPTFEVVTVSSKGVLVASKAISESALAALAKALELFANAEGVVVYFNGNVYTPASVSQAA